MTAKEYGRRSLRGLWVGDCIGNMNQIYNIHEVLKALEKGIARYGGLLPANQFQWSDDTEEAIVLYQHILGSADNRIDVDKLAMEFAKRYMERDPDGETYGYGLMTRKVLRDIYDGVPWWEANRTFPKHEGASSHVDGLIVDILDKKSWVDARKNVVDRIALSKSTGDEEKISSCGNGSAMRVAPLGALLSDYDEKFVAEQAALSALPTHNHEEGIAGAMAIARMAQLVVKGSTSLIIDTALGVPDGTVKRQLEVAASMGVEVPLGEAIKQLGNGTHVTCQDTVPLCCWLTNKAIVKQLSYEQIIEETSACQGDVDTNCAIVGGLVGIICEPAEKWVKLCKPLEV